MQNYVFFRIKRQTHTHSEKSLLTILKIKKLKACTCLSNTYTTHTQHVHGSSCSLCMWCVRLVYMFNKHVHAQNYLINKSLCPHFYRRVCVWRLILKKSSLVVFLCHNSKSVLIPLQNRFKSVP